MPAANLDQLKMIKDVSRQGIVFAMVRLRNNSRCFFGGSDFKIYEVDLAQAKPEPRELGGHRSYVTGLALAGSALV